MGALKLILIYSILLASIASAIYIVKQTHSCDCLNKIFFFDLQNLDLATEAGKWSLLRSLLAKISLYVFVHAIIIMNIRIFTGKSSPATQEDPTVIKVINRIITNSIEQSIIFVGLYTYFLFDKSGDRFNNTELTVFASWFLLSRVAFSASYLIGSIIGLPSLRGFGFALNFATILFLIELSFSPQTPLTTFFFEK